MPVVNQIMATDGFQKIMEKIGEASPVLMSPKSYDYSKVDTIVNALYKFQDSTWNTLVDKMPSLSEIVNDTVSQVGHLNTFLGINIGEQPLTMLDVYKRQLLFCFRIPLTEDPRYPKFPSNFPVYIILSIRNFFD